MPNIYKVDLKYLYCHSSGNDEARAAHEAELERRRTSLARAGIDYSEFSDVGYICGMLVSESQLLQLVIDDQRPEIKQTIPVKDEDDTTLHGTMLKFNRLAKKLISLPGLNMNRGLNEVCQVHMPGQALSTYNETLLMQDKCTDELQEAIDRGWRIIAVCPQPDQRRPDYILGRFNPERKIDSDGARRSA